MSASSLSKVVLLSSLFKDRDLAQVITVNSKDRNVLISQTENPIFLDKSVFKTVFH